MSNFELLQGKLDTHEANPFQNTLSVAESARNLLLDDAQKQSLLNQNPLAEPESFAETFSSMLGHGAISAGVGIIADIGLSRSALARIPKIGTPLALATPYLVAGATDSCMKSHTPFDLSSLAAGAGAYATVYGIPKIMGMMEAAAFRSATTSSAVSPIKKLVTTR